MNALPRLPLSSPMLDKSGILTPTWLAFFRELYGRVGGTTASSNSQLTAIAQNLKDANDALAQKIAALSTAANGIGQGPAV